MRQPILLLILAIGLLPSSFLRADTFVEGKLHRPLREPLTSFGAAVVGDYLYVFSGHDGSAVGFGRDALSDHFRRIKFDDPNAKWEELSRHEPAQSTALVSDGKYLYRIGGLTFLNTTKEKTNFKSTTHFARYDIASGEWTNLAPLPKGRSSLDAAVVGRSVFVAGGWNLQGASSRSAEWHDDIIRFDLDNPKKGWQSIKGPGYITRAFSAASHKGKFYILGGIQRRGFSRKVSIYDPKTGAWSQGPELKADSRTAGFATSAFEVAGKLYYTGSSGVVYRLTDDGKSWQLVERLLFPRMFLRLLPTKSNRLLAVGGTGSGFGRMSVVESLPVSRKATGPKVARWSVKFGGRAKHSQIVVLNGNTLYAIGGNGSRGPHDFSKEAFVKECFAFDLTSQQVKRLADLPQPLQSGAGSLVAHNSEHQSIAVIGGLAFDEKKEGLGGLNSILLYDAKSNGWTRSDVTLPKQRAMFHGATYDDAVWLFAGSSVGKGRKLAETVLFWWGDESDVRPLPNIAIPTPRRSFGGAKVGKEYFVVGGLAKKGIAKTVDVFDFEKRSWRQIAAPKVARIFPSLAATKDKLYLFGGFTRAKGHFAPAKSLEEYDLKTKKWRTVAESVPGVPPSMKMLGLNGERLLFYGIDRKVAGKANFVLVDPQPQADPGVVAAMSFSRRRAGGGRAKLDAKALMRRDRNLDGRLSAGELGKRLASFAKKADVNGDGFVTYKEAVAALSKQASKASRGNKAKKRKKSKKKK